MADGKYIKGVLAMLAGTTDWLTSDIKAVCVDAADYTVDLTNDEFLSDIAAGARVATSGNLSSKTRAQSGTKVILDAGDETITGVSGDQFEAVVVYHDTGTASTSPLLAYIDTATGLPYTPSGGGVVLSWAAGGIMDFE